MKRPFVMRYASCLLLVAAATSHCSGGDSSTSTSSGSGGSASVGAATGSGGGQGATTVGAGGVGTGSGAAGSTASGSGGAGGARGTGGAGGFSLDAGIGTCPASRPTDGTACPDAVSVCQYGTVVCACGNGQPWTCLDLGNLDGGFSFDAPFNFDGNFRRD